MKEKRINPHLKQWRRKFAGFLLSAFFIAAAGALAINAADDEFYESPEPVLISKAGSIEALTANPDDWRGTLPVKTGEFFPSGSRVVIFVTNVNLLPDEAAGAFRAFAEDASGKQYRLSVENVRRLSKQNWIYGLTLRIHDAGEYNGQPPSDSLLIRVSWRGNTSNRVLLNVRKSNAKFPNLAGLVPTPAPETTPPVIQAARQTLAADRKRFMEQAAFGPSKELDLRLSKMGLRRWIEDQFTKPYPTIPYPNLPLLHGDADFGCGFSGTSPEVDRCRRDHYGGQYTNANWMIQEALYGEDQLRRRMSWALHQIWVVAAPSVNQTRSMQEYIEILDRNAFGNYRDLMKEMTLSPAMGEYLDMARSTRQNPNENYPRELLQLFTIGLYELNQDGTLKLDSQGNRIPTYDQDKIDQFTKVFTGWTHCNNGNNPVCANAVLGTPNYIDPMHLSSPNNHDQTAKTLFNYPGAPNQTIATCANCTTDAARTAYANDSLNKTLDNIFYHPNVGPFIGKLLIQHFVTSDPSPAYVGRVAAAFNNNGTGTRGDMKAVVKAILLDPEVRGSRKTDPTYGKLREPLQFMTNFLRTFNVRAGHTTTGNVPATPPASCQNRSDGTFHWMLREMGQVMWSSPTVFNYFPPDYVVPGTDILGPEFALANTGTSFARNNHILNTTFGSMWLEQTTPANPYPNIPCGTSIDLSEATALATADPTGNALIEWLNVKMMHGTMSDAMKSKIRTAINFNVSAENKAKQAIYLVASSSQYQIQR